MKTGLLSLLFLVLGLGGANASDLRIPEKDIDLMRTTDHIDVTGTNDLGGQEAFSIQDRKAIRQFIDLLTDDRYTAAPKSLRPKFKSLSIYQVRLSSNGASVLEFRVIADSVLDLPGDPMFYLESDQYSANLMAPLLRLR
jgi:hypothetical protein